VAGTLDPVWLPWLRGRFPGPHVAAVGVWLVLCATCGRRGAWPVTWAPCGRRGGVAGTLGPVWPPCDRGRSPGPRVAAVGAWPVTWAPVAAV